VQNPDIGRLRLAPIRQPIPAVAREIAGAALRAGLLDRHV
jgi:hypothetical protein